MATARAAATEFHAEELAAHAARDTHPSPGWHLFSEWYAPGPRLPAGITEHPRGRDLSPGTRCDRQCVGGAPAAAPRDRRRPGGGRHARGVRGAHVPSRVWRVA